MLYYCLSFKVVSISCLVSFFKEQNPFQIIVAIILAWFFGFPVGFTLGILVNVDVVDCIIVEKLVGSIIIKKINE